MTSAQVDNNNIANRSELILDSSYVFSNTKKGTVEWECISKALTNKCLVYHNDQWFKFRVSNQGKYYINLITKDCLKKQGIQAIVIEGNPCEINTYKILECVAQIRDGEAFIALDSLAADNDYLINIDGFLGDYCSFEIQLSSIPYGLSVDATSQDTIQMSTDLRKNIVFLNWSVSEPMAEELINFEVVKTHNRNRALLDSKSIGRDALGNSEQMYSTVDTLKHFGTITYEIVGNFKSGVKQILNRHAVNFFNKEYIDQRHTIELLLPYKNGSQIQMILLDKQNDQVLRQTTFEFAKKRDGKQQIDVTNYLDLGITNFIVRTIDLKTRQKKDYEFNFR